MIVLTSCVVFFKFILHRTGSYRNFERKMLQILASHECEPDSAVLLLQAFKTIGIIKL